MKTKIALTTSLCALLCGAACFTGTASFAEENSGGIDYYPSTFVKEVAFDSLDDYAISGDKYAFLQNNVIYEYYDGGLYALSDAEKTPASVYYTADGELCYGNSKGVFVYETNERTEIETAKNFDIENYHYYVNSSTGTPCVLNTSAPDGENPVTSLAGFTNLKQSGGKAYAVKDNALYEIKGSTPDIQRLYYLDYSDVSRISRGDINSVLNSFSLETPRFVTLKDQAFMTETDLDKTDEENGEYFSAGKTVKAGSEVTALTALLLAQTGKDDGISLVMISDESGKNSCYLMNSDDVRIVSRNAVNASPKGTTATVTVAKGYIYSAPYVCASTHVTGGGEEIEIESGLKLEVLGEVTKEDNPELARSFYKIKFTEDGEEIIGYVPTGYVSHFTFIENGPVETDDPTYTEESAVKVVVLVLLVVALVLGAGGYMIYSATSGKRKKTKKTKKSTDETDE